MKKSFCTVVFFLSVALLPAQTAAELERVLALSQVSCGDAAWLILNAAGTVPPGTSVDGAFSYAADNNWLPKKAAAETPFTLGGVSFLIMKAFNIRGGFMYTLFPGPRSGYRELVYRKVIQGRAYSTLPVSGERILRVLDRALEYAGDAVALPEAAETLGEIPPVRPTAMSTVQEERERIIEIIHTELEEKRIADTDVRTTSEGVTISLNNIQFLPDSTELTEAEKRKLQNIAAILNEFPDRKILVGGHTAMAGSTEGRTAVSTARAQAVADYLVSLDCREQDQITVRGYGAEQPLGDPATPVGQALNRRVEITLLDGSHD